MDEEMEGEGVVFEAYEVDIDYEFDAVMFFDFTLQETHFQASQAELWFQSAQSYPPSPFIAKLVLREDYVLDNDNASKKSEDMDTTFDSCTAGAASNMNNGVGREVGSIREDDRDCEGGNGGIFTNLQDGNVQKVYNQQLRFTSGSTSYKPKLKAPSYAKPSLAKGKTLMKPTASHLARQNWPTQPAGFKLQNVLVNNSETSYCNSGIESQAIKKQKLDGGHSRQVNETKQQNSLVHKLPKKDEAADKITMNAKLKITIPREPDLETAHRAQRIRSKNRMEEDHEITTTRRFRARPLNKKILEAPSLPLPKKSTPKLPEFQEFHLRTLERAMQNASTVSSSSIHCSNSNVTDDRSTESRRLKNIDGQKHDRHHVMQNFKACPLNTKIFSCKGAIGVTKSSKQEATIPMEFKFHNEKRILQPPTELFNKLSLTSQLYSNNGSMAKIPCRPSIPSKSSKENSLPLFHPQQKVNSIGERNTSVCWKTDSLVK